MASSGDVDHNFRHKSLMLNRICEYWKDEKYCDVILKIGKTTVKCHKLVLAACFEYFRGMFDVNIYSTNLAGYSCDKLSHEAYDLSDVEYESICLLIEYAYTGKIKLTVENVQKVLMSADYFGNIDLKKECEALMLRNIDIDNCMNLFAFADHYSLPNLQICVINFIGKNFDTLLVNGDLQSMPLECFMKLYKSTDLLIFCKHVLVSPKLQEQYLFRAALIYCMNRPSIERENIFLELLKYVRLPLIEPVTLKKELEQFDSISSLSSVKQLVDWAIYISFEGSDPISYEDAPNVWKSERILSLQVLKLYDRVACNNRVGNPLKWIDTAYTISTEDQIQDILIWTRYWCNVSVVSGIKIRYRSGRIVTCGGRVEHPIVFEAEHVVELEDGEVITKVAGRHGWLIDCIEFHTNFDRKFGPFGGNGGNPFSFEIGETFQESNEIVTKHETKSRYPDDSTYHIIDQTIISPYLHGIISGEVLTNGHIAITHLGFLWLCFKNE